MLRILICLRGNVVLDLLLLEEEAVRALAIGYLLLINLHYKWGEHRSGLATS